MGKLIVRYKLGATAGWGLLLSAAPTNPSDMIEIAPFGFSIESTSDLIVKLDAGVDGLGEKFTTTADALLSPVTSDATIFAQGLNYGDHASEAQHAKRTTNLIFSKASSTLTGPYAPIMRPAEVELLDYEVEFGIVLRRDLVGRQAITEATLGSAVAGIVLCNDVSARDTMFGTSFLQWFRGKSYRTFCPAGPVLWYLAPEEVADALQNIEIKLSVDGDPRQLGQSQQLIWKPTETLNYITSSMDMKRGDLLLTGTPGGVTAPATLRMVEILKEHLLADEARRDALRVEMQKGRPFLKPGNVVTATMTGPNGASLGGMANTVQDEG